MCSKIKGISVPVSGGLARHGGFGLGCLACMLLLGPPWWALFRVSGMLLGKVHLEWSHAHDRAHPPELQTPHTLRKRLRSGAGHLEGCHQGPTHEATGVTSSGGASPG